MESDTDTIQRTSAAETQVHMEARVTGVVQGVGFRPFVYKLACDNKLTGVVWNDSRGVLLRVQGGAERVGAFFRSLSAEAPSAAHIDVIEKSELTLADYSRFEIVASQTQCNPFAQISPDLALCKDCKREYMDAVNRRVRYPFINCTQCGPRFTITQGVPYDRPSTTMAPFTMCKQCAGEYSNPLDRRFHAQPIACWECGPTLEYLCLVDGKWQTQYDDPVARASELLANGKVLVVQGIGGFHLACDAQNELAVQRLRLRKHRDKKPLAVMFPDEYILFEWCIVSKEEAACLNSPRAPIVLVDREKDCPVANAVAPDHPSLGAMLPYSPLHLSLLGQYGKPIVLTSANIAEHPICFERGHALQKMRDIADGALVHDRAIHMFADDSVVRVVGGIPRVWRRSRGFVPESIPVRNRFMVPTLGMGGELKNTFALGKENSAILSQHLGDMEHEDSIRAAELALEHFLAIFSARIGLIACDLHPGYATTRMAERWSSMYNTQLVRVQHHHAHLAACLAEHQVSELALCLALDGTGYGTDGKIWGGELLYGDFKSFTRLGNLEEVPLLGNDQAARQPWRMALAWLERAFGDDLWSLDVPLLRAVLRLHTTTELHMLTSADFRKNFIGTTSLGRLFDAAAALICFGSENQYEGQAAMKLEGAIHKAPTLAYGFEVFDGQDGFVLSPRKMFSELVKDIQSGVQTSVLSRRFHETIAQGFADLALRGTAVTGCRTVALGGGCFQNAFLLTRLTELLEAHDIRVLSPANVPANDGGLALGQICIANAQSE